MQIRLKLKNDSRNNNRNSNQGMAGLTISRPTRVLLLMKHAETTGLRPRRSDIPGMINWPMKPPRPMAEMMKAMDRVSRCR